MYTRFRDGRTDGRTRVFQYTHHSANGGIMTSSEKNVKFNILIHTFTSVDTEMCCPKGKCGCQYFILLTLKKKNHGHRGPGFF